jgi:hypothetical protein
MLLSKPLDNVSSFNKLINLSQPLVVAAASEYSLGRFVGVFIYFLKLTLHCSCHRVTFQRPEWYDINLTIISPCFSELEIMNARWLRGMLFISNFVEILNLVLRVAGTLSWCQKPNLISYMV